MDDHSKQNLDAFDKAIAGWRDAYQFARLNVLGFRDGEALVIIAARLYLATDSGGTEPRSFRSGRIEAYREVIDDAAPKISAMVAKLASPVGLLLESSGLVRLPSSSQVGIAVTPVLTLYPSEVANGNRMPLLTVLGAPWTQELAQPETDWLLKGADRPYDSLSELASDFDVGALRGDRSVIEVAALTGVQVWVGSSVVDTKATLGTWLPPSLDRSRVKLGFRVLDRGRVIERGSIGGGGLRWIEQLTGVAGVAELPVPVGAVVQCIASYDGEAHQVRWLVDPKTFANPRAMVLAQVDPTSELVQSFLQPSRPLRGTAANDFESAISWLLWAIGFSPALFGLNPKTTDAPDIVAVTPRGDFLVVECTVGLLRNESKLSRVEARAAGLRDSLRTANMGSVRVLALIVTAMTADEVKADTPQAEGLGILVWTKEDLDRLMHEVVRASPDADGLFVQWSQTAAERLQARTATERSTGPGGQAGKG